MTAYLPKNLESPEVGLIVECLAGTEVDNSRALDFIKDGIEWNLLHRLAIQEKVLPLLFTLLCKIESKEVPVAFLAALKNAFVANASRNVVLAHRLIDLLDLLAKHQIEALAYKGPALAIQAYRGLSLRTFGDLDILIRPEDLGRVYEVLINAGFQSLLPLKPNQMKWLLKREPALHFAGKGFQLDVHWAFENNWPRVAVPPKQLWEERETIEVEGRRVSVMSCKWTLLSLLTHGVRHNWEHLQLVADIYQLGRTHSEQLQTLLSRKEIGNEREHQDLNLALMDPAAFAGKILRNRGRMRMGYLLRELVKGTFIPKQTDWMALNLPDRLYGLYYGMRPCRLLWKYVRRLAEDARNPRLPTGQR